MQLTETATGNRQKIAIVGQDGVPYPEVHYPVFENGTKLLIPPATRYAIAVTMPEEGDLILEMPPRGGGASTISAPGLLYTNDGTENPPAVLGSLSVLPTAVSYYDGFFVSPTQVLAKATTTGGKGVTTEFKDGQKVGAYTVFEDISQVTPDVERELTISGGFLNNLASTSDAKSFTYVFEGKPNLAAAFMPFGLDYKGGLSLATGWLGGTLGGAERIVVGQLGGPGQVKVFSSGSALQGGPAMYLAPADHSPIVGFGEMASFTPFDGGAGVTVATTSTTDGANLLVSGVSAKDKTAQVVKYELVRPSPQATNMVVKQLGTVVSAAGSVPNVLGGD